MARQNFKCSACKKGFWARSPSQKYCHPCGSLGMYRNQVIGPIVQKAIRQGRLDKPTKYKCLDCGGRATCWDHRDYSKPLKVEPVCNGCNLRRGPGKFPKKFRAKVRSYANAMKKFLAGGTWELYAVVREKRKKLTPFISRGVRVL